MCAWVGSGDDADDLFQEALMVLFDKVKKEDFELTSKLSTYILSICKYNWFNKQRKKSNYREVDMENSPEIQEVEGDMEYYEEQEEQYTHLQYALNKLGSPCKEILEAFYIDNRSMDEISDIMSYTNANNAKTQKYKCLNRLKKIFKTELKNNEQFRLI